MAGLARKIGVGCLSLIGVLALVALIGYFIVNESKPEGKTGNEADKVAQDMLQALNKEAWDSLNYVSWDFMGRHQFDWDKQGDKAIVKWESTRVVLDLDKVEGTVTIDGQPVSGDAQAQAVQSAWNYWCNDSFWLCAHYKLFDPGVELSIVDTDEGSKGLMASYASGGVTPGDSYLWILDDNNLPVAWKMWVKIAPIGGLYNTWENWKTLPGGAMVAQNHKSKVLDVVISDLKAGQNISDIGYSSNPFTL